MQRVRIAAEALGILAFPCTGPCTGKANGLPRGGWVDLRDLLRARPHEFVDEADDVANVVLILEFHLSVVAGSTRQQHTAPT